MKTQILVVSMVLSLLAVPQEASAQMGPEAERMIEQTGTAVAIDDLVVTARRTDAPIWQVRHADSTLILVGSIGGVPRDLDWRPDALEQATAQADRILMPQHGQASLGDIMRLIWRIRTISRLPDGTTSADYLSPEAQARLEAVMSDQRNDNWRSKSFVILSMELMTDRAGYQMRRTRTAAEVVTDAAKRLRKPVKAVGTVRGDELVESLISLPPEVYVPCLEQAVAAAEAGPEATRQRIADWRMRRVPHVMAQPLQLALNLCWPWGDPEIAPLLRQQWSEAARTALTEPGVTLGVAQLTVLAEPGGVLDQLSAEGFEIDGPMWKTSPHTVAVPSLDLDPT